MTDSALLDSELTATDVLENRIVALKQTPEGRKSLAKEMRLLAVHCARYPGDVQGLWDTFKSHQPAGVVTAFRETVEGILGLLDGRLRITSQLRDLAEEIASIEGSPSVDEGVFVSTLAELQNIRDHVDEIWKWANSPPTPLDLQMVKESREAREHGEGEDVRDILDRFRATGHLPPE